MEDPKKKWHHPLFLHYTIKKYSSINMDTIHPNHTSFKELWTSIIIQKQKRNLLYQLLPTFYNGIHKIKIKA